jgi:O-acetyl-ADP-ribose deacetylase (regulator of RNase III)
MLEIIKGDLIQMAKQNQFGVIAHGCNCFNTQKAGIAREMALHFKTDEFPLEQAHHFGDINKLGCIDSRSISDYGDTFIVVNMYTQYHYKDPSIYGIPLDYDALTLCLRKLAFEYADGVIGLPMIGAGLARGNWESIVEIIRRELKSCHVKVVIKSFDK